jgi:hypothetical protein
MEEAEHVEKYGFLCCNVTPFYCRRRPTPFVHVTSLERLSHVSPKSDEEVSMPLCSTKLKLFSFLSAIQGRKNINSYLQCISVW